MRQIIRVAINVFEIDDPKTAVAQPPKHFRRGEHAVFAAGQDEVHFVNVRQLGKNAGENEINVIKISRETRRIFFKEPLFVNLQRFKSPQAISPELDLAMQRQKMFIDVPDIIDAPGVDEQLGRGRTAVPGRNLGGVEELDVFRLQPGEQRLALHKVEAVAQLRLVERLPQRRRQRVRPFGAMGRRGRRLGFAIARQAVQTFAAPRRIALIVGQAIQKIERIVNRLQRGEQQKRAEEVQPGIIRQPESKDQQRHQRGHQEKRLDVGRDKIKQAAHVADVEGAGKQRRHQPHAIDRQQNFFIARGQGETAGADVIDDEKRQGDQQKLVAQAKQRNIEPAAQVQPGAFCPSRQAAVPRHVINRGRGRFEQEQQRKTADDLQARDRGPAEKNDQHDHEVKAEQGALGVEVQDFGITGAGDDAVFIEQQRHGENSQSIKRQQAGIRFRRREIAGAGEVNAEESQCREHGIAQPKPGRR